MLIIDSPGVQATVSLRAEDGVDQIVDAQLTESFLYEVIPRISDILVWVVNDFTWPEQKYVQQFYEKFKLLDKQRDIIVVHNLRNTRTCKEARALFEKQLTSCYGGAESFDLELVYTATEERMKIHHVAICQEFSEAGEKSLAIFKA